MIVRDVAVRMGFGKRDTDTLALLVRHHLTLVDTATRRDPDDPATADLIAKTVGTQAHLELLHALTEADATATGPAAWSSWRASLVATLVERTAARLVEATPGRPPPTPRSPPTRSGSPSRPPAPAGPRSP